MTDYICILGLLLVVSGIAMVHVPSAVIAGGVLLVLGTYTREYARAVARRKAAE